VLLGEHEWCVDCVATKTSSKDFVELSDGDVEHFELWNSVFVSGCGQTVRRHVSYSCLWTK